MEKKEFSNKRLLNILRIIIVILIIMIAILWVDTFIRSRNNLENPEQYYISYEKYNEVVEISDNSIVIKAKNIDEDNNTWLSVEIPKWQISLDIPEEMIDSIDSSGDTINMSIPDEYYITISTNNISSDKINEIKKTLADTKNIEKRAKLHMDSDEDYVKTHVDYMISDTDIILISDVKVDKSYGYKYSIIRGNNITSVRFTKEVSNEEDLNTIDTSILNHLINTINVRI